MNTYERFIEANNALRECFTNQKPTSYEALTPFEKEQVCKSERDSTLEFITNGSLTFKSLVQERIDILDKQA